MHWAAFFPAGTPVVALPSWSTPRLYVAAWSIPCRWNASALFPAFRQIARWRKACLRFKASIVGEVRKASTEWALERFLQETKCGNWFPWAVLVGTPGPGQKYIVQLRDGGGKVVGYFKYGESVTARRRMENEWKVLRGLPEAIAPRPLKLGPVGEGLGLLVSAVPGRLLRVTLEPSDSVLTYLMKLSGYKKVEGTKHPWLEWLLATNSALEPYVEELSNRTRQIVPYHGDLAPWNLTTIKGKVWAIDWEYGSLEGFPGADVAYYVLQVGALLKGWPPEKCADRAARALARLPWPGMSPSEAEALVRLVAYDAYVKALEDGHPRAAPLQRWRERIWRGT